MSNRQNAFQSSPANSQLDVNEKYTFLKKIGKGNYGEVWLVLPNNPSLSKSQTKQYVLKRLDLRPSANSPSQNDLESAEREAQLLSTLKHPNIVAYTESFCSNDGFLNIVMAYCEGGDLYTKLKEKKTKMEFITEDQIIEWFIQICMALQYIHDKNILHRDLKTQNIFLTKNDIVKVGDLGIARTLKSDNEFATTIIGTPYYMSPEIFSQKPYGQKSDIWSLGCCVYEMTTLEHAFNAKDISSLVIKILREQTPQMSKKYSEQLVDIIKSMLKKNPDDRPTAKQILQNSYIKQHILRLLEKTQIKCQNQTNSKIQTKLSVSPASSPSRPNSSSKTSPSRIVLSNENNNTPILPSYQPLPPSHSRPPSAVDPSRSAPLVNVLASNEHDSMASDSRTRRRHSRHNRPSPSLNDEQEKQNKFLSNVRQNDTIVRRRRDHERQNQMKQNQQPSSSDDQDSSPARQYKMNSSQPIMNVESSRKATRPNSVESSRSSSRPSSSQSQTARSYDCNQVQASSVSTARQRRREYKIQSSSTEYSTSFDSPTSTITTASTLTNTLPPSTSQECLVEDIEKKKEGEKDMNDFLFMLTSTLQLSSVNTHHLNQSGHNVNDRDRITNENESSHSRMWSSGYRTMSTTLNGTSRMQQIYDRLREYCLREISSEKLRRVLKIIENVDEPQMIQQMIYELGEDLYNRYSGEIFSLKFYQDHLIVHQ